MKNKIRDIFLIALAKHLDKKLFGGKKQMNGTTKKWWQSKTIWSGIITIVITVYNTVRPLLLENFGVNLPEIPSWIYTILGAIGIYGRVTANKGIK